MIIQIAGTNGAGKSTVVRAVMMRMDLVEETEHFCDFRLRGVSAHIRVLGRYEEGVDTGGCDRIRDLSMIYQLVHGGLADGCHVLWEGASSHGGLNQTRGPAFLVEIAVPYVVMLLTTPFGQCLEGITSRRSGREQAPLEDEQHVRGNYKRAQNYAARMRDAGARVVRCSREEAPGKIIELLRQT